MKAEMQACLPVLRVYGDQQALPFELEVSPRLGRSASELVRLRTDHGRPLPEHRDGPEELVR